MDIRVIDRGPGIRREDRDLVFRPFQRLGDSENLVGVGLGLAVARGFVEAVGGELDAEDTPGGGCTMVIRLSRVDAPLATDGSPSDGVTADGAHDPGPPTAGHTGAGRPSTTPAP
jgi:two-component system sensor histidine kinase KdpD